MNVSMSRNLAILVPISLCIFWVVLSSSKNHFASADNVLFALDGDSVDLGELHQGDSILHKFTLQNSMAARVRIAEIQTSCTCTVAGEIEGTIDGFIPVGHRVTLPITLDVDSRTGNVNASVVLVYHLEQSSEARRLRLNLRGNVSPEVSVEPKVIDFGSLNDLQSSPAVKRLKIVPFRDDVEVLRASSSDERINVTLEPKNNRNLPATVLQVSLDPKQFANGEVLREAILVELSSPRTPQHRVKVIGRFAKSVEAYPSAIVFRTGASEVKRRASVTVRTEKTSIVTNATLSSPDAGRITVLKGTRSKEHKVHVLLNASLNTSMDMVADVELAIDTDGKTSVARAVAIPIHLVNIDH